MAARKDGPAYFIRLPGKNGFVFVEVDLDKLKSSVLTDIYERADSVGKSRYVKAMGADLRITDGVDTSSLLETVQTVTEQCRDNLQQIGESGGQVYALLECLNIAGMLETLGRMDCHGAEDQAREALYAFMSKACELAQKMADCQANAQNAMDGIDGMHEVGVLAAKENDEFYLTWAKACEDLVNLVACLDGMESDLQTHLEDFTKARTEWMRVLEAAQTEAVLFLDSGTNSFMLRTFSYRDTPEGRPEMVEAVRKAVEYIEQLNTQKDWAQDAWLVYDRKVFTVIAPRRLEIQRLCTELGDAWKRLNEKERAPDNVPRPHQVHDGLISEELYQHAQRLMHDPKWGKRTTEKRLTTLIDKIDEQRGTKPELPTEVREVVKVALRHIELVQEQWRRDSTPAPPAVAQIPDATFKADAPRCDQTAAPDQVYEMVVAIGYVVTCRTNVFCGTTANAMLKTLAILGKISEEDVKRYSADINDRVRRERSPNPIPDGGIVQAFKTNTERWIFYRNQKGIWINKLTRASEEFAMELMRKHELTREGIKTAFHQMREARNAAYMQKATKKQ